MLSSHAGEVQGWPWRQNFWLLYWFWQSAALQICQSGCRPRETFEQQAASLRSRIQSETSARQAEKKKLMQVGMYITTGPDPTTGPQMIWRIELPHQ